MFEITDEQRAAFKEVFDSIVNTNALGKLCKLYYQPKMVDCQCASLEGNPQASYWLHGGPLRVDQQSCNMCGGTQKIAQENTENITMTIDWRPIAAINYDVLDNKAAINVRLPFNIITTRGFVADWPKIKKAIYIEIQLPILAYGSGKYKLRGEPGDSFNFVQDKYFLAVWDRVS